MNNISRQYSKLLQHWINFAVKQIYRPSADSEIACYGPGNHGHWALQANTTALSAFAVLATNSNYTPDITGLTQQQLLQYALSMLRFTLRTHHAGGEKTLDGQSWGRSWISPLCLERMMHAIEAIADHLHPEDWQALKKVLISECEYLTDEYEVVADIDNSTCRNKPESNIWSGALLLRTVMMFPEIERADEFSRKGTEYLLAGISIPSDAMSDTVFSGSALSEWHTGANFTENFALNHHGYLNVGYMVICLSNIAMLHFAYKKRRMQAPSELYNNIQKLWQLIKQCTFDDGRLWRIGGDTRVRYCYCQDYAIPMWKLAQDVFGDAKAAEYEKNWLDIVATEQRENADGSFLGQRLTELEQVSPLYYSRLEADKAVTLSMGLYWHNLYGEFESAPAPANPSGWSDEFHGAMLEHGKNRLTSFVWHAAQKPQAMCVPSDDSSMAEWRWNLIGEICGTSGYDWAEIQNYTYATFEGGFNTCGSIIWKAGNHVAEGQAEEETALENIAFAALPDDCTTIVIQQAQTINRTFLKSVKGLFCNIPNDIFNHKTRNYSAGNKHFKLEGSANDAEVLQTQQTSLTVDEKLSIQAIYGSEQLSVNRPGRRQVSIFSPYSPSYDRSGGNLYCDEICSPCIVKRQDYPADYVLFDHAFTIATQATPTCAKAIKCSEKSVKAVLASSSNGKDYIFAANFSESAKSAKLELPQEATITRYSDGETLTQDASELQLELPAFESVLLEMRTNS